MHLLMNCLSKMNDPFNFNEKCSGEDQYLWIEVREQPLLWHVDIMFSRKVDGQ